MKSGCSASIGSAGQVGLGSLEHLVVEDVAALVHRALDSRVADDDDRLQALHRAHLLVDRGLDRRRLALAPGPVDRDQRLRFGELHPLAHRFGAEAAEDDVVHGPDPGAGEHRDRDLGDHRQVDPDDVALAHPEVLQGVGEALDLAVQVGVGEVALLALLPAPVVGDPLAAAGLDVAVEAVGRGVEPAVGEPPVEGRVGVVEALRSARCPSRAAPSPAPATRPRGRPRLPHRPSDPTSSPAGETPPAARSARSRASPPAGPPGRSNLPSVAISPPFSSLAGSAIDRERAVRPRESALA